MIKAADRRKMPTLTMPLQSRDGRAIAIYLRYEYIIHGAESSYIADDHAHESMSPRAHGRKFEEFLAELLYTAWLDGVPDFLGGTICAGSEASRKMLQTSRGCARPLLLIHLYAS